MQAGDWVRHTDITDELVPLIVKRRKQAGVLTSFARVAYRSCAALASLGLVPCSSPSVPTIPQTSRWSPATRMAKDRDQGEQPVPVGRYGSSGRILNVTRMMVGKSLRIAF